MTNGSSTDTQATHNVDLAERVARVEAITQERASSLADQFEAEKERRSEIVERLDQRFKQEQDRLDEIFHRIDQRFEASQESLRIALNGVERAQDKFESQAKALQIASNEWRAAMNDREKNFPTRVEVEARFTASDNKIDTLGSTNGASIQYIERKMTESFENLRLSRAANEGGSAKLADVRVWIMAGVAFIVGAITILGFILNN